MFRLEAFDGTFPSRCCAPTAASMTPSRPVQSEVSGALAGASDAAVWNVPIRTRVGDRSRSRPDTAWSCLGRRGQVESSAQAGRRRLEASPMGNDTANLTLHLENSASFLVRGGSMGIGTTPICSMCRAGITISSARSTGSNTAAIMLDVASANRRISLSPMPGRTRGQWPRVPRTHSSSMTGAGARTDHHRRKRQHVVDAEQGRCARGQVERSVRHVDGNQCDAGHRRDAFHCEEVRRMSRAACRRWRSTRTGSPTTRS